MPMMSGDESTWAHLMWHWTSKAVKAPCLVQSDLFTATPFVPSMSVTVSRGPSIDMSNVLPRQTLFPENMSL